MPSVALRFWQPWMIIHLVTEIYCCGSVSTRPANPALGRTAGSHALATGVFTGDEAQIAHELSGILKTGKVAQFGNQGDGRDEWHAAQGAKGFSHWQPAPALPPRLECCL